MNPESPFYRWPKGSMMRASAELNIAGRRAVRAIGLPLLRWMTEQRWIVALGEWLDAHTPRWVLWFTPWRIAYLGVALYGAAILIAFLTRAA